MLQALRSFYFSLHLRNRFFWGIGCLAAFFVTAFFVPLLLDAARIAFGVFVILFSLDLAMVFGKKEGLEGHRKTPERFSNGDPNPIQLQFRNFYNFSLQLQVIDELPFQFQKRDLKFALSLKPGEQKQLKYELRPTERGEYHFGQLNAFVSGPIGLVMRRYRFSMDAMVPTYPSYLQMKQYQLMAVSNRLKDLGVKKVRKLGHTTEFEQIKEYVRGDDYRTINWKATARSGKLMVNQYADEKSQDVYCLIDKSRAMKMPFEGLSLLDHAINASLVIANVAIQKQDRAGLITFAEKISTTVPASSRNLQMSYIQEALYNQRTRFLEADYARLYAQVRSTVNHRSLLVLFTNFESLTALRRQLPSLQKLANNHLLLVVFFENTELKTLLDASPRDTEEIYIKTIGENFAFEKKQIVRELEQHGILAILTPPQQLTVNTLNKYLEIKSRGMI
jgi:uncharacterized protein (DUF58 family)